MFGKTLVLVVNTTAGIPGTVMVIVRVVKEVLRIVVVLVSASVSPDIVMVVVETVRVELA